MLIILCTYKFTLQKWQVLPQWHNIFMTKLTICYIDQLSFYHENIQNFLITFITIPVLFFKLKPVSLFWYAFNNTNLLGPILPFSKWKLNNGWYDKTIWKYWDYSSLKYLYQPSRTWYKTEIWQESININIHAFGYAYKLPVDFYFVLFSVKCL